MATLTARSPEMLAPAKMPVAAGKKMEKTEKSVSPRKSGPKFSAKMPAKKRLDNYVVTLYKKQGE